MAARLTTILAVLILIQADVLQSTNNINSIQLKDTKQEKPLNFLLSDLLNISINTQIAFNCSASHRASMDPNKFEKYSNGQWVEYNCPTSSLIWKQDICRCDYLQTTDTNCMGHKAHEKEPAFYYRLVHGTWNLQSCQNLAHNENTAMVWNQTSCSCVSTPVHKVPDVSRRLPINLCKVILNITFNSKVTDDSPRRSWIEKSEPVFIRNNSGVIGGGAGYFVDAPLKVWSLSGNGLTNIVSLQFRFRPNNDQFNNNIFQTLISNGCDFTWTNAVAPSLSISFCALNHTFRVRFTTSDTKNTWICRRQNMRNPYGWHTVLINYQLGSFRMLVDNQVCLLKTHLGGVVTTTQCPLTLGGDPLERERHFRGYLDEVLMKKQCKL